MEINLFLYKFHAKVKKSEHESEDVYVIAHSEFSALKQISSFTIDPVFVSVCSVSNYWENYDAHSLQ